MAQQSIILGGGCFWCIEAVFQRIPGVIDVTSGYAGGKEKDPSYREVSYGKTLHAEVVNIIFDDTLISLDDILAIFFEAHDPTTLDQQGNDVGKQYRSIIFYADDSQRQIIEAVMEEVSFLYEQPIVTELVQATSFYPAEIEHRNYYNDNSNQPYCQAVIAPKLERLEKYFE